MKKSGSSAVCESRAFSTAVAAAGGAVDGVVAVIMAAAIGAAVSGRGKAAAVAARGAALTAGPGGRSAPWVTLSVNELQNGIEIFLGGWWGIHGPIYCN